MMDADEKDWRATLEHERKELEQAWQVPHGFLAFFCRIDHRSTGRRFIVTALAFFALAGILAAMIRLQLAVPNNSVLGPDLYNQIFTVHGTTMMFLFAVPVMLGLGIYFVPLMVGAREIAFPRAAAFAYWMFLLGGIFLWVSFLLNVGPDAGWFSYPPLSGPEFGIGKRPDVWAQLVTFTETSATIAAVCIVVTILKLRAPGMSINRMPLFVWSELVTALMVIFSLPSVVVASLALILDRLVGTHFYNQAEGGDPILWQHLFWFFAHPEVYIIFLPATGMVSTIITTFSRRPMFGYLAVVLSLIATAFIGFGVWVHHMFTTGLPQLGISFFTAASIMIVVPTGVQFFCWIATLASGRIRWSVPLAYVLGFFVVFLVGGLTGVMLASVPLDMQVHDTFFVVAHLHYVLVGGAVFPLLGGLYYWYPKMTGRMLNDRLGVASFAFVFTGFNLTFFPMHILGLMGMPRRVYTYPAELGWGSLNLLSTIGAATIFVGLLIYFINTVRSCRTGPLAPHDPWEAPSLEWAVASPPPVYNFHPMPTVSGRDALWHANPAQPIVTGFEPDKRDVLVTRIMDAEPDHRIEFPQPTPWVFLTAVTSGILYIGSMFTPWAVVWFSPLVMITLIGWFWPKGKEADWETDEKIRNGEIQVREDAL
jgi:cytochrome c oxidase subunit I